MQGKRPPAQGPLLTLEPELAFRHLLLLLTLEPELAFRHLLLLIHNPVETGKARSP